MLVFRPIDPERDRELVLANRRDAYLLSFGDLQGFPPVGNYLEWVAERVRALPTGFVLASDPDLGPDHPPVGQIELQLPPGLDHAHVNLYYVAQALRGKGYGRALHRYVEDLVRAHGVGAVQLKVAPGNVEAITFYERLGFTFLRQDDRPDGRLVWIMRKEISPITLTTP